MENEGQSWYRSGANRDIYANAVRLRLTPHDVNLIFGLHKEMPGMTNAVQEEVTIVMSFSYAKIVAAHLATAIAAVEQELGPIKIPADALASEKSSEAFTNTIKQYRIK